MRVYAFIQLLTIIFIFLRAFNVILWSWWWVFAPLWIPVAAYIANLNVDTIDLGVPVLSMHAPYEIIAKADIYTAHQAFEAFFKA